MPLGPSSLRRDSPTERQYIYCTYRRGQGKHTPCDSCTLACEASYMCVFSYEEYAIKDPRTKYNSDVTHSSSLLMDSSLECLGLAGLPHHLHPSPLLCDPAPHNHTRPPPPPSVRLPPSAPPSPPSPPPAPTKHPLSPLDLRIQALNREPS